jgi:hypothetical protein
LELLEIISAKRQHLDRLATTKGAAGEAKAINEMEHWLPRPRGRELKTLITALRDKGVEIKGSSFDAIAIPEGITVDFSDADSIATALPRMTFIEIKTANQPRVREDFSGFFFALTESEIAAAAALGEQHRVALYNRASGEILLTSVPELISRARSMNWQVSIQL